MSSILIIISIILIIPTCFLINSSYFILYIIGLLTFLLFTSCFNHVHIKNRIKKYYDIGYYNTLEKIVSTSILKVLTTNLIMIVLIFLVGYLLTNFLKIDNLWLILLVFGFSIWTIPTLDILNDYLNLYIKKINFKNIYYVINIIYFIIMVYIVFNVLNISLFSEVLLLSLGTLLSGILITIYALTIIISKNISSFKTLKEEISYDYKKEVNQIFSSNIYISITNIVKYSYLYLSIIIVYKLYLKYSPSTLQTNALTNTYFYMILIVLGILIPIINSIKKYLSNDYKIEHLYYNYIVKSGIIVLTTCFMTYPISKLLLNDNRITLGLIVLMAFVYSIYYITLKILITLKNPKKIIMYLISGLILNIIILVPMIESFYRMGYSLVYGSIFSIILSLLLSIVLGINYINKKYQFSFNTIFEKTLNIIYKSIIIVIILLVIQFIINKIFGPVIEDYVSIIIYLIIIITYLKANNYFKKS